VLYAHPLPKGSDLAGASASCAGHGERVLRFLQALGQRQPEIAEVYFAWEQIPSPVFGTQADREFAASVVVREGLFRDLVLIRSQQKPLATFQFTHLDNAVFREVWNHREIALAWLSPLRNNSPSQRVTRHGRRTLVYGPKLREKQRVKRIYGVLETQFRSYFQEADRRKGLTGENLLVLLERRLDNVAYSLGFASSRPQARQLIRHGHVLVDGRRIIIPSYQVKAGQAISIKQASRKNPFVRASIEGARDRGVPEWLELDPENVTGKVLRLPIREDIKLSIQEQLIVDLYSR
jgi:small subunit ribosomal protein S4